MSRIAVVGDIMIDSDWFYKSVRTTNDGVLIVEQVSHESRLGGAGAAYRMAEKLHKQTYLAEVEKMRCLKVRRIVDNKVIFRQDRDYTDEISSEQAVALIHQIIAMRPNVILVSDYGKGVVTTGLWRGLVKAAELISAKIIVDPAANKPLDWYNGAWAILPNQFEAKIKSELDVIDAAKQLVFKLTEIYPNVCIKLGRWGMVHTDGQSAIEHTPARRINLVDHCGAGDMVAACIAVATVEGQNFGLACQWANKMAAYKCEHWGAIPLADPDAHKEGAEQATSPPSPQEQQDLPTPLRFAD